MQAQVAFCAIAVPMAGAGNNDSNRLTYTELTESLDQSYKIKFVEKAAKTC